MLEDENVLREDLNDLSYDSSTLITDALLSFCYTNARPGLDSKTGKQYLWLIEACHRWLEWDLYKEDIRIEAEAETLSGIGGNSYSNVSTCAITALCYLGLLKQCTTEGPNGSENIDDTAHTKKDDIVSKMVDNIISTEYYAEFSIQGLPVQAQQEHWWLKLYCVCAVLLTGLRN